VSDPAALAGAPPFVPALLLGSAHAQTIWPVLFRRRPRLALRTETWTADDGGALTVHFAAEPAGRPGVLVLHGLEGSVDAPYVGGMLARLAGAGLGAAALEFRSCGRAAASSPARSLYHAGKTDDLAFVVDRLRARWAGAPLAVVGYSLGGNVLLKWLGERGREAPLAGAVAVSTPYDLAACAAAIDARGLWPFVYRERFLRSLRRKALAVAAARVGLDPAAIARCRTFAAFDDVVTAPLFGFAGAADYWARASSAAFLPAIRRPALLVSAEDDPFVPGAAIPRAAIATNPALTLWLAARGGHVGFVSGSPWRPRYAAEELALRFVRGLPGFHQPGC
jgi:predicted alpha/beta-fold hydrolase